MSALTVLCIYFGDYICPCVNQSAHLKLDLVYDCYEERYWPPLRTYEDEAITNRIVTIELRKCSRSHSGHSHMTFWAKFGHTKGWPANQKTQLWSPGHGLATVGNGNHDFIAQYKIYVNDRKAASVFVLSVTTYFAKARKWNNSESMYAIDVLRKLKDIFRQSNPEDSTRKLKSLQGQCEQAVIQERASHSAARTGDQSQIAIYRQSKYIVNYNFLTLVALWFIREESPVSVTSRFFTDENRHYCMQWQSGVPIIYLYYIYLSERISHNFAAASSTTNY